jgi:hypothetical protein
MHAHVQEGVGLAGFGQVVTCQGLVLILQQGLVLRVLAENTDDQLLERLKILIFIVFSPGLEKHLAHLVSILSEHECNR